MKLSVGIDLAPVRQRAIDAVNAWAETQTRKVDAVPTLHAAKLAAAARRPELLVDEARARDVSVETLRTLIRAKADEAEERLLEIDARRRATIAQVAAASTEDAIWAAAGALHP